MKKPRTHWVARKGEYDRLFRFFTNPHGGSMVIGGNRGSGKSALVQKAIEGLIEYERGQAPHLLAHARLRLRSVFYSRVVPISIPLVIIDEADATKRKEAYRSHLLRAILIGLEADLMTRKWPKIDLPMRWFRSIGYVQNVYALRPYSHYITQSKSTNRALSAKLSALNPSIESAISAEMDLSVSSLEIKLRNLIQQYRNLHKFVFVFDELDKLPEDILLEDIVLYLKNLFSDTGALAIFITDEVALQRISKKAEVTPPTELTTLFVDRMLLDDMTRGQFIDYVEHSVVNIPVGKLDALIAPLTLRTHRSPYELSQLIIRHGANYEDVLRGLKTELGLERFESAGVMQLFIDYVFTIYAGKFDVAFDRDLNQLLQEAGDVLLAGSTKYIHIENPHLLFYTTELFKQADLTQAQIEAREKEYKAGSVSFTVPTPDMVIKMRYDHNERRLAARNAIECLLTLLNRSGILPLYTTSTKNLIAIGPINVEKLSYEKVQPETFGLVLELSRKERAALAIANLYGPAYRAVSKQDLLGGLRIVGSDVIDNPDRWGKYSLANILCQWEAVYKITNVAQQKLVQKVAESITGKLKLTTTTNTVAGTKTASLTLTSGKRVDVTMLFENQKYNLNTQAAKTFVLRDQTLTTRLNRRTNAVKNYSMTPTWTNYERVATEIATHIDTIG